MISRCRAIGALLPWKAISTISTRSSRSLIMHSRADLAKHKAGTSWLKGVIFDMDGTLTVPAIDFAEMRQRAGIPTGDILAALDSLPTEQRLAAEAAILAVEEEALPRMQLMPGVLQLCSFLDEHGIPRGLITRNSQRSLDFFHQNHFHSLSAFAPALSRAFRPYKPSPGGILHICRDWLIQPSECLMVGDSPKDDIVAGNRAGAKTMLLDLDGLFASREDEALQGELRPTFLVQSLEEALLICRQAV